MSVNKIYTKNNLTVAEANALVASLNHGHIWPFERGDYPNDRKHSRVVVNRLYAAGLLTYETSNSPFYSGGYILTEKGRMIVLELPDTESSASREYQSRTGKYLPYAANPELNPSPYTVGGVVESTLNRGSFFLVDDMVLDEHGTWWYTVRTFEGGAPTGSPLGGCRMDLINYAPTEVDVEIPDSGETEAEVDWGQLGPKVAEAAVLLAAGRGDELVVLPNGTILPAAQYDDDVTAIAAIDLIRELVADYEAFGQD
jgi:hypothetical protein